MNCDSYEKDNNYMDYDTVSEVSNGKQTPSNNNLFHECRKPADI